ncbi:MAG TPA: dTDP-4-dehydrorhamnose reductase [Terracidiphilus sp.]|nr:dTDP-4-dehydrorhamnose reductase [Terracidiphilus sp.]
MAEDLSKNTNAGVSSSPRILILGAAGQLGVELQRRFATTSSITAAIRAVDRSAGDLANPDQIRTLIRDVKPEVILNAAAYTAVDRAESEPELAHAINAVGPRILAEEALRLNALLVHYSTDYVFDGSKSDAWTETDPTNPLNVYGASKLAGEHAIQSVGGRFLIFRTSWVYGAHGKNFLLTMLRLGRERDRLSVVDDQFGAPTTSIELARATQEIVRGILANRFGAAEDYAGLYHMTCAGATSWFGFAQAIFVRASVVLGAKMPELTPIPATSYPTPAARPRNSILSNEKLRSRFGVELAPWQSALDAAMAQLKLNSA